MPQLVSVVIPTYNRDFCIAEAVDSALAQTYEHIEIIVVDDGSTDNTRAILEQYDNKIIYIYQKKQGVSCARNTGIKAASGEWIAFLDSDDEWLPTKIASQFDMIDQYPDLVAHATDSLIVQNGEELSLLAIRGRPDFARGGIVISRALTLWLVLQFFTPSIMVKKMILIKAGMFDVSMSLYEDLDCFTRVALYGPCGFINDKLTVVKRKGPNAQNLSSKHTESPEITPRAMLAIYKKLLSHNNMLIKEEISHLNKSISSMLFKIAIIAWQKKNYLESLSQSLRSIMIYPSPINFVKIILMIMFGSSGYRFIREKIARDQKGFRRSNL